MADFLQLHLAVKAGNLREVQRLLSQGHDIGKVNPKTGINSLHLAVLTGNYDIVELLSRDEAHINSRCCLRAANCGGYTPLHFSVDVCDKNITQLLLSRKANVNYQNKCGDTALHIAARYKDSKRIIHFLLIGGITNPVDGNSLDILNSIKKRTTINGYCEILDILLQSGANAQLVNKKRETALHLACRLNNDTMTRIILRKCSSIVNYKNRSTLTALHIVADSKYNNSELVNLLLEYGADIDSTDCLNSTPLFYACKEKNFDVVQILVEEGCNVNIGGKKKPIHIAIYNCDEKILKLLLKHGADTSNVNSSLSFNIASYGKINLEIVLLEKCCNVFFKSNMDISGGCDNWHSMMSIDIYFDVFKFLFRDECFKNIGRKMFDFAPRRTIRTSFVKFVIKIKTLGCFFARDYPDIDLLQDEKEYEENCKKEVEVLKGKFVCSDISLLDFLKKDLNKMVRLLRNQEIVNVLECSNYNILPIYDDLIKAFFKFGMQRRTMLNRCYECFNNMFCQFPKLPDMVVENIFDSFTTEDFGNLLTAWDPYY